ncbi:CHASE2 domain-containing protein [Laspinema olomoucense]|uniref:CHASE2 domain-containing protein n=1 Tax=Laspinema olomoucense TaxID=3231600 RepID=UPI0021BB4CAD|nr:CHASE2 domain-containing protein [Laspinema sp. D3d]MCT7973688.1 CHASE2 domain-containing protein [Laspinema sp. D3d]
MGKLVVIKLDGDFQRQEVRVMLEIGLEGDRPWIELPGKLPRSPELSTQLYDWVEKYRNIGEPSRRIKTKKIIYDGGIEKRIEECCEAAEVLSERFNDWLESPEFRHCDRRLREELSREDEIRVLIRTGDRQLQKLPWHLWDFFDRYVKAELALSPPSVQAVTSLKVPKQKVKILAILGHDEGIETTVDRQILENLPQAKVNFLVKPQYREINDSLWEEKWDILFFAGHSESENERGVIYINEREKLSIAELKYGLRKAVNRGLQLAIFNSCDGLGLAQELAELQIPQTIVMREPVPDRVAHEFLKNFLQAFSHGEPFYLAVRQARERLQGLEKEFPCATWLPVICQNPAVKPLNWTDLIVQPTPEPIVPAPQPQPIGRSPWQTVSTVLFVSVLVTSLVMGMRALGVLEPLELKAFDRLMQLRPSEGLDSRITIVKITDKDLPSPEQTPLTSLPDDKLDRLLKILEPLQPRAIGLNLYRDFPVNVNYPELAAKLQQNSSFIALCAVGSHTPDKASIAPPNEVSETLRLGFGDILPDDDRVLRRYILGMSPSNSLCQTDKSFSLQVARHYLQAEGIKLKLTQQEYFQLGRVVFQTLERDSGGYHDLDSRGHQILLNYRAGGKVAEELELSDILQGRIDPDLIRDRIVLIGTTASRITNLPTPIDYDQDISRLYDANPRREKTLEMPPVVFQAHAIAQILGAVLDNRPLLGVWPKWGEMLWIWCWSVAGGLVAFYLRSGWHFGTVLGAGLGSLLAISFVFLVKGGWWVPLVPSALGFVTSGGSVAVLLRLGIQGAIAIASLSGLSFLLLMGGTWVPLVPSLLALISSGGIVLFYNRFILNKKY